MLLAKAIDMRHETLRLTGEATARRGPLSALKPPLTRPELHKPRLYDWLCRTGPGASLHCDLCIELAIRSGCSVHWRKSCKAVSWCFFLFSTGYRPIHAERERLVREARAPFD
jgi:hypothetical protein